jgi:hypothetical protein
MTRAVPPLSLQPLSLSPPAKTAPKNSNRLQAIFSHPRDTLRERVLVGDDLASYLDKTHKHGLETKDLKALEERYKDIPANIPATAPMVNKQIWDKLPKPIKDGDTRAGVYAERT